MASEQSPHTPASADPAGSIARPAVTTASPAAPVTPVLAALVGVAIPVALEAGVEVQFQRIAAIAAGLMRFELPEDLESAAVFRPEGG